MFQNAKMRGARRDSGSMPRRFEARLYCIYGVSSMKDKIEIAKIVNTNGVRGAVKCIHYCDDVYDMENFDVFFLKDGRKLTVDYMSFQKNTAIIKFKELSSANEAELLRDEMLYIDESDLPELPKGVYYISDLIGLQVVVLPEGNVIGKISDVLKTGANDVYVINKADGSKKQYLIPAIPDVIDSVDIDGGVMKITPIAGLIDDED